MFSSDAGTAVFQLPASVQMLPFVRVQVLVAGDTGVSHLAAALGTPVVALFGPTDPAFSAPRGAAIVLTHPVPCAPCFYRVCPIEHPCLDGISAARVVDAITTALAAPSRGLGGRPEPKPLERDGGFADGARAGGFGGRPEPPNSR